MQSAIATAALLQQQRDRSYVQLVKREDDLMVLLPERPYGLPREQIDIISNCLRSARTSGQMGRYRFIIGEIMTLQQSYYVDGTDSAVSWANKQFICATCQNPTSFDDVITTFQLLLPHNTYSCVCLNCF